MSTFKTDFTANAAASWGENDLPDWVGVLAEAARAHRRQLVALRIGYSTAVVSAVIRANYNGDLAKVEAKVRGAFMGETVACPILGELARDACLDEQARPFSTASSMRTALYRACRGGCPHSKLKETADAA